MTGGALDSGAGGPPRNAPREVPTAPRPDRAWIAALAVFVGIAVAFAPDAVFGTGVFWHHDLRHHHFPWRVWGAETWAAGEVPWWAPGAGNGFPLLAEGEGGLLYLPTMLLFVLLPDALALDWSILGHQVLAAMGVWAFLRARGLRGVAPLVGGAAFAWSGFLISHTLYLGMQNAVAWAGWALLGAVTARGWLVALAIGMMGLAGHPQIAAFLGLGLAVHAAFTLRGAALVRWGAAAAAGVVVAAPQLLATLELVRFSGRDGGVEAPFAQIGKLPLQELVGAVLPYAFGFDRPADIDQTYYHRGTGYWGAGVNHWEMCFYLGMPVVALAVAGLRRAPGWAAGGAVAAFLMLGGPAWELVRHLPGFDGFRFPARFAVLLTLATAVLAAEGVARLRSARRPARVVFQLRALAAVFSLGTGAAYGALHVFEAPILEVGEAYFLRRTELPPPPGEEPGPLARAALPPPEPEDPAAVPEKVRRILADLRESTAPTSPRVWVPVALLLLASLAVRRPAWWLFLVVAELWRFGHAYHPRVPAAAVAARPAWLVDEMTTPGGARTTVLDRRVSPTLDTTIGTASLGLMWGTSDVIVPSPLLLVRNEAVLALAGLDVGDRGAIKVRRYLANIAVARRLGVRFVATTHAVPGLTQLVAGPVNVYADPNAAPRARVVPCARAVTTVDDAFTRLGTSDWTREVVVEGAGEDRGCGAAVAAGEAAAPEAGAPAGENAPTAGAGTAGSEAPGAPEGPSAPEQGAGTAGAAVASAAPVDAGVTVERYTNQEVRLRAAGPGTLVLADTWYPRWSATVNGAPAEIARADVIFRGVQLPDGESEVVFRFDPGLPGLALWGAVAMLLGIAGAAVVRERSG